MFVTPKTLSLIFFSLSMFANGTLFIPQAVRIIKQKSANDLSLVLFLGFNVIQLATVIHGYFQQDKALMIGMGYSFLTCATVSMLIIYYRTKKTLNFRG